MTLRDIFRANLKAQRLALGLDQTELAGKIGVKPSIVSRWESGAREPHFVFLARIAKALGTKPADLLAENNLAKSA